MDKMKQPGKRQNLIKLIDKFMIKRELSPPLSLEELKELASEFSATHAVSSEQEKWLMIMLNNAVWRETVATVPFHRRIFLLPQCLRNAAVCKAQIDEFGLLCDECGGCIIGSLQKEAENLGMMSLVAEGSTVVGGIIENGGADAVIGVSCLSALEKAFPYMVNHAVPGMAVPLLSDGCINTQVDEKMIREMLQLRSDKTIEPVNLNDLNTIVSDWFIEAELDVIMGQASSSVDKLGRGCLTGPGKRRRPYLAAAVYRCLTGDKKYSITIRRAAIAVECFHKASLIHDDIEDNDDMRYGNESLHRREGIPVALNIGDFLIGEGYRMISECELAPGKQAKMLKIAATGHLTLCRGQGEELDWMRQQTPLTIAQVIEVFRGKTAPAFEVALSFGALCANADEKLCALLSDFSTALGIAYQIHDDIEDYLDGSDIAAGRLSVVLAAGCEQFSKQTELEIIRQKMDRGKALNKTEQLYEHYRNQAVRSLRQLKNSDLKRLLFRITGRILQDVKK